MSGYHSKSALGSFPMDRIKRVDRPTTFIDETAIERRAESESGFNRASRGDFGAIVQRERPRFGMKHPLSAALVTMQANMIPMVDGVVASQKAPITNDPEALALHVKKTAYFLRSDAVGICELPPYAVYTHCGEYRRTHRFATHARYRDTGRPRLSHVPRLERARLDQQLHEFHGLFELRVHRLHTS